MGIIMLDTVSVFDDIYATLKKIRSQFIDLNLVGEPMDKTFYVTKKGVGRIEIKVSAFRPTTAKPTSFPLEEMATRIAAAWMNALAQSIIFHYWFKREKVFIWEAKPMEFPIRAKGKPPVTPMTFNVTVRRWF